MERNYSYPSGIRPYKLKTPFIALDVNGLLTVYRGYSWDGPSGLTITTKSFMRGSLVHDALYQLIRLGLLPSKERANADELLQKICQDDDMNPVFAKITYLGVRTFGWLYVKPST